MKQEFYLLSYHSGPERVFFKMINISLKRTSVTLIARQEHQVHPEQLTDEKGEVLGVQSGYRLFSAFSLLKDMFKAGRKDPWPRMNTKMS